MSVAHAKKKKDMTQFFGDVVQLTRAAFLREYWHSKAFIGSLGGDEEAVEAMVDSFCEADVSRLIATCRKPCNSRFSSDEMAEMERDLDSHGRTLNLPYCFCRGAKALHAAAVDAFGELANDIEVGVYLSNAGGDVAEWHKDANHNFTIQLTGAKEWRVLPGGEKGADGPRGMFDPPRNRAEQLHARSGLPPLGEAACYSLAPGSVLYVPPGHWHRVVPTEGGSLSVDVRIGHLTAAKWLSEALFATSEARRAAGLPSHSDAVVMPSSDMSDLATRWDSGGGFGKEAALRRCPVPRVLPCEDAFSDGLQRAASLAFLARRLLPPSAARTPWPPPSVAAVGVSSMFTLAVRRRDATTLHVGLLAVSALTGLEYCRFGITCGAGLHDALVALATAQTVAPSALARLCAAGAEGELRLMLRVLLHANALFSTDEAPTPGGGDGRGDAASAAAPDTAAAAAGGSGGVLGGARGSKRRR